MTPLVIYRPMTLWATLQRQQLFRILLFKLLRILSPVAIQLQPNTSLSSILASKRSSQRSCLMAELFVPRLG